MSTNATPAITDAGNPALSGDFQLHASAADANWRRLVAIATAAQQAADAAKQHRDALQAAASGGTDGQMAERAYLAYAEATGVRRR